MIIFSSACKYKRFFSCILVLFLFSCSRSNKKYNKEEFDEAVEELIGSAIKAELDSGPPDLSSLTDYTVSDFTGTKTLDVDTGPTDGTVGHQEITLTNNQGQSETIMICDDVSFPANANICAAGEQCTITSANCNAAGCGTAKSVTINYPDLDSDDRSYEDVLAVYEVKKELINYAQALIEKSCEFKDVNEKRQPNNAQYQTVYAICPLDACDLVASFKEILDNILNAEAGEDPTEEILGTIAAAGVVAAVVAKRVMKNQTKFKSVVNRVKAAMDKGDKPDPKDLKKIREFLLSSKPKQNKELKKLLKDKAFQAKLNEIIEKNPDAFKDPKVQAKIAELRKQGLIPVKNQVVAKLKSVDDLKTKMTDIKTQLNDSDLTTAQRKKLEAELKTLDQELSFKQKSLKADLKKLQADAKGKGPKAVAAKKKLKELLESKKVLDGVVTVRAEADVKLAKLRQADDLKLKLLQNIRLNRLRTFSKLNAEGASRRIDLSDSTSNFFVNKMLAGDSSQRFNQLGGGEVKYKGLSSSDVTFLDSKEMARVAAMADYMRLEVGENATKGINVETMMKDLGYGADASKKAEFLKVYNKMNTGFSLNLSELDDAVNRLDSGPILTVTKSQLDGVESFTGDFKTSMKSYADKQLAIFREVRGLIQTGDLKVDSAGKLTGAIPDGLNADTLAFVNKLKSPQAGGVEEAMTRQTKILNELQGDRSNVFRRKQSVKNNAARDIQVFARKWQNKVLDGRIAKVEAKMTAEDAKFRALNELFNPSLEGKPNPDILKAGGLEDIDFKGKDLKSTDLAKLYDNLIGQIFTGKDAADVKLKNQLLLSKGNATSDLELGKRFSDMQLKARAVDFELRSSWTKAASDVADGFGNMKKLMQTKLRMRLAGISMSYDTMKEYATEIMDEVNKLLAVEADAKAGIVSANIGDYKQQ